MLTLLRQHRFITVECEFVCVTAAVFSHSLSAESSFSSHLSPLMNISATFPLKLSRKLSTKEGTEARSVHKLGYVKKKKKKERESSSRILPRQSTVNLNRSLNYCYCFGLRSAFFSSRRCCQAANRNGTVTLRRLLLLELHTQH